MKIEFANTARSLYHGQYVNQTAIAAAHYAALNFPAAIYHTWCANEWKDGRDWLDASESIWANLIGANTTSLLAGTYSTYTDICSPEDWIICQQNYSEAYCMLQCCREDQVPYYVSVQAGSDGLVPIYSQQSKVSNWSVGSDRLYEAVGVNHHEMRGHTNMRGQLSAVFNRNDVFKVELW
jgi:hypothetical protein